MKLGRRDVLELGAKATAAASLLAAGVGACALGEGRETQPAVPQFRLGPPAYERVTIATRDGQCPAYVFKPRGHGPWPAAIFLIDGLGIRPNLFSMAQRLADGGYLVLMPDLFYRHGPYEPLDVMAIFAGQNRRQVVRDLLGGSPDNRMMASDAASFLDHLSSRRDVASERVGVTGYCMSGGGSLTIAGTYPDRIAAAASFHGGNLATDSEMSPHLLAPSMRGQIYIGVAETDVSCPPEMVARLETALTDAGVHYHRETYAGTVHGWTMRDTPVYNEAGAERHWRELFAFFGAALA